MNYGLWGFGKPFAFGKLAVSPFAKASLAAPFAKAAKLGKFARLGTIGKLGKPFIWGI